MMRSPRSLPSPPVRDFFSGTIRERERERSSGSALDDEEAELGHFLDGPARALAAEAAVAHAAVGHEIDPEGGGVVVDEAAHLDGLPGAQDRAQIVGEEAALEAEAGGAGHAQRLVERVDLFD